MTKRATSHNRKPIATNSEIMVISNERRQLDYQNVDFDPLVELIPLDLYFLPSGIFVCIIYIYFVNVFKERTLVV